MINNVQMNAANTIENYTKKADEKNAAKVVENGTQTVQNGSKNQDSFVKSSAMDSEQVTYSKPKTDYSAEVNSLLEQHEQQLADFKAKILSMIKGQSSWANGKKNGFDLSDFDFSGKLNANGNITVNASAEDIAAAQEAISEDGEWGVNAVADRIMNFAYALADGDESKIQLLKNAVIAGFKAAGFDNDNRSGCGMPEITGQTYDEIMSRFDAWENGETAEEE